MVSTERLVNLTKLSPELGYDIENNQGKNVNYVIPQNNL